MRLKVFVNATGNTGWVCVGGVLYLCQWRARCRPCAPPGLDGRRSACSARYVWAGEAGCGSRCPSGSGLWRSSAPCPACAARRRCLALGQRWWYTAEGKHNTSYFHILLDIETKGSCILFHQKMFDNPDRKLKQPKFDKYQEGGEEGVDASSTEICSTSTWTLTCVCLQVLQQRAASRYSPLQAEGLGPRGCTCTTAGSLCWPLGIVRRTLSPPAPWWRSRLQSFLRPLCTWGDRQEAHSLIVSHVWPWGKLFVTL